MSIENNMSVGSDEDTAEVIEIEVIDDDGVPASAFPDEDQAGDGGREPDDTKQNSEIEELTKEIEHLREMYLRKLAEFDNYRKRTERGREDFEKTAGEAIVLDLIPVLDNFERALEHASESEPGVFREGVSMISKQLMGVLGRRGLEQFDPQGQVFEPELHEAVQRVVDPDHPPGTVAWVLARGYRFGGRLVRPAMVGVSMATPDSTPPAAAATSDEDAS